MRKGFRPRPIDFGRAMPVVRAQSELELNDEGNLVPKKDLVFNPLDDGDMLGAGDDEDLETLKILNEQYEKDVKKANIPVPPIIFIEDYEKHVAKDYVKPNHYIRWKALTDKEMDEALEFEMDEADMEYVRKTLPAQKLSIKEEKFEAIVDRLEKESYKLGKVCDISVLDAVKLGGGKVVNEVYNYWVKKRNKWGKPLMRRFQPPTSINDTSPHSTFRPREKEEKRIRRTRKNDKDAHKKLKHLQADFRRAKEILERCVRREKMKKVLLELDFCLQFAKDIKDIPPGIIEQHQAFFQEMQREKAKAAAQKKGLEGDENEPLGGAGPNQRQRPAVPRPSAVPGQPEEQILPAEEQGTPPEKLEALRRCFLRLMKDWGTDGELAGTSLLPVSGDGKFCTEKTAPGNNMRFRGRARIGRGGRVIFDRASAYIASLHRGGDASDEEDGARGRGWHGDQRRGDRIGAVLSEMKHLSQNGRNKEDAQKRCNWNFGGGVIVSKEESNGASHAPPKVDVTKVTKAQELVGLNGVKEDVEKAKSALSEKSKASLGQLSGVWGKLPETNSKALKTKDAAMESCFAALLSGKFPVKKIKRDDRDTSTASTSVSE